MSEEQAGIVTRAEQAVRLKAHYDEISDKATDWYSAIPQAIDAWVREPDLLAERDAAHAAGVAAERARVVAVIEEVLEGLGEWYSTEAGPALEGVLDKVRTP